MPADDAIVLKMQPLTRADLCVKIGLTFKGFDRRRVGRRLLLQRAAGWCKAVDNADEYTPRAAG